MEKYELLLEHIKRLYISCRTRYVVCRPGQSIYVPKRNGNFSWLTDNVLLKHLKREYAIGVYAGNSGSKFICFDADDGNAATVAQIIAELEALGIARDRVYVSISGRKGYHVEVFFDTIVETQKLLCLYRHVIRNGCLDPRKVEFRPTPKMAIKLPLSVHGETGNICWYVDPVTLNPIEDEEYIAGIEQISIDNVNADLCPPKSINPGKACFGDLGRKETPDVLREGCIGIMLTEPGTRHETMVSIAVYNRHRGATREENQNALEEWYALQPPEMIQSTPEEVQRDITQILNWVYSEQFSMQHFWTADSTFISENQLGIVLDQASRSARRISFLLLARTRMRAARISAKDIGAATGFSTKTVYAVIHKLVASGTVSLKKGKTTQLPDLSFSSESSSYIVLHKASCPHEKRIQITMRDLIFDFDRIYHKALSELIHPDKLRAKLSAEEWSEHAEWIRGFEREGNDFPKERRIDLMGTPHRLILPLRSAVPLTAYVLDNRWLFPACKIASAFGCKNPSLCGSTSPHKELWRIQVTRRIAPNGMIYHQVLSMNFIPLADVLALLEKSGIPEKEELMTYFNALKVGQMEAVKRQEGVIAS